MLYMQIASDQLKFDESEIILASLQPKHNYSDEDLSVCL